LLKKKEQRQKHKMEKIQIQRYYNKERKIFFFFFFFLLLK